MRHLALMVGAAALGIAGPALAKPGNGHGHGHGHDGGYGYEDDRGPMGYGAGGCPPGLRNKGCMPPGQARKLYRGERYESGYGTPYTYRRLPYELRRRYDLSSRYRYYYDNGTVYVVDPRTMLISQVISALIR